MIASREEELLHDLERFRNLIARSIQMQMMAPGQQPRYYYAVDKGAATQILQDTRHWIDGGSIDKA